jgi:hypothetical protein
MGDNGTPLGLRSPGHWAWAQRLLLARLTHDDDAEELIVAEIGGCPHCWRIVADGLTGLAVNSWRQLAGDEVAIELMQNGIAWALDKLEDGQ